MMNIKDITELNNLLLEGQKTEQELSELHKIATRVAAGEVSLDLELIVNDTKKSDDKQSKESAHFQKSVLDMFINSMPPGMSMAINKSQQQEEDDDTSLLNFNDVESLLLLNSVIAIKKAKLETLKVKIQELNKMLV